MAQALPQLPHYWHASPLSVRMVGSTSAPAKPTRTEEGWPLVSTDQRTYWTMVGVARAEWTLRRECL